MDIIYDESSSKSIVARSVHASGFNIISTPLDTLISSGVSTPITIDDLTFNRSVPAVVDKEFLIEVVETVQGTLKNGYTVQNLTPSIGSVNDQLKVSRISDGLVSVLIKTKPLVKRIDLAVKRISGQTIDVFTGYESGSLSEHCSSFIDSAIDGLTPNTSKPIYSTQNHLTSTYVRNTSCWAYGLDLTPISPWNSMAGNLRAGTLVSPRHIVFAAHYTINNGSTIRFITADNQVVSRTLVSQMSGGGDLRVGLLDSDVPETIGFVKVLPSNWANYFPSLSFVYRVPTLVVDQEEKALVNDLRSLSGGSASFAQPQDVTRYGFFELIIDGDSGNPAFLIINGELVLICTWQYGGAGSGPSLTYYASTINAAMTALGGGYQLTVVDLSGLNSY